MKYNRLTFPSGKTYQYKIDWHVLYMALFSHGPLYPSGKGGKLVISRAGHELFKKLKDRILIRINSITTAWIKKWDYKKIANAYKDIEDECAHRAISGAINYIAPTIRKLINYRPIRRTILMGINFILKQLIKGLECK